MTLALSHQALQKAARLTSTVAKELTTERAALDRATADLMATGWTGQAANDFRAAMTDWHTGAQEVLDALGRMGHLIEAADRRYAMHDAANHATVQASGAGLGQVTSGAPATGSSGLRA